MDTGLKGKNALITGGSSGIGRGIAEVLAEEGVNLVIASRNPDLNVIRQLAEKGIKCTKLNTDVSIEEQVINMVEQAIRELGHIDFYINNSAWAWHKPITKIDSDSWYKTLNTNLSSCMWACREVCKHMIENRKGSIIIIGSTSRFNPAYKETSYRISKMGLKMYMQNLAIEMAPFGIRVNMITPGHFKTRMTADIPHDIESNLKNIIPAQSFGNPLDVGYAAAFILSDKLSNYSYGTDLVIDGGLSLRPLDFFTNEEIKSMNL